MGAPQARLSELAEFLIKKGHDVIILTAMPNYPTGKIFKGYDGYLKIENVNNIEIIRCYIYPSKSISFFPRIWNYLSFTISSIIIGLYCLPRCDYIITESPPLFLGVSGYILSKFKKAKLIFNVSDLWIESAFELGVIRKGVLFSVSKYLENYIYNKAWRITGQSKGIIWHIDNQLKYKKTYRLSNGVDLKKYYPGEKNNSLRLWKGERNYAAIYTGLHGIAQGLDQIIELALMSKKNNQDIQFILIGDGPEKSSLIDRAKKLDLNNITFIDPIEREKIPHLMRDAELAIIPLKKFIPGAVPSKLYEAMALELPILFIGVGEPADIVKSSNCGVVSDPDDIKSMFKGIDMIIKNKSIGKKMGANGRAEVEKNYNRKTILNNFVNFLKTQ
jgi:colanic acid biosynthesis glycosyl transferase WcaI